MKSLKMKILTVAVLIAFAVSMLIVGIYAAETQKITMQGTVSFEIADKTLYVKDVRLKNDNTLTGQGTTLNNFKPGFINGEYKIDLGSISSDTSFTLYFDIVNTTSTFYSASENSTVSNASVSASGIIRGDAVDPTTINSDTPISGTVQLDITISNPQNVNLNNITILLNEYQEPEVEHNDLLDFTFDGNTLTSYTGSDSEVIIPSSYSIRPSDNAFVAGNDYSVTAIGGFALANCNSTSITIPSSITSLGTGAFANCKNLTELNYNATSINNLSASNFVFYNAGQNTNGITVNFANGVSTIPAYLFNSTNSTATSPKITQVNMPSTVTAINSYAFGYLSSLKSITLPSSLTSIGDYAFSNCSGLTSITLPSNLTSIGSYAFYQCSGLTGALDLSNCTSLTSIGNSAFSSCSGLTSIIFPSSLTSIGTYAFRGCSGLANIDFSHCTSLTSIGRHAFRGCSGLTEVDLSNCTNLTSIGSNTFYGCNNLTSIIFPNTTGWYRTASSTATSGTNMIMSDPEQNAEWLTDTYVNYYFKRNI